MDCKKYVWSNSTFVKVNESSMYWDMGLVPAQNEGLDRFIENGPSTFWNISINKKSNNHPPRVSWVARYWYWKLEISRFFLCPPATCTLLLGHEDAATCCRLFLPCSSAGRCFKHVVGCGMVAPCTVWPAGPQDYYLGNTAVWDLKRGLWKRGHFEDCSIRDSSRRCISSPT